MRQVVARIGAGGAALGALTWVLWPSDWSNALQPEPLFAFSVAVCVWVATEIFDGSNGIDTIAKNDDARNSLIENDLRNARQILAYHKFTFRELLKSHDLGGFIDYRYMSELHSFNHANRESQFEFLDIDLVDKWKPVAEKLRTFALFMAQNSTPEHIGGREMVRLDYMKFLSGKNGPPNQRSTADEGNELATEAWEKFDRFVSFLKGKYPEVTDTPVEDSWFYAKQRRAI